MLVITRKVDQSIMIDDRIEVVVTGITKDGVRLGVVAPREVQVHRREVYDAIVEANKAASSQPQPVIQNAVELLRQNLPKVKVVKGR